MENDTKWTCQKCGLIFQTKDQDHHCIPQAVNFHLNKCSASIQQLFFTLEKHLKTLGHYEILPVNASVQFKSSSVFLTTRFKKRYIELEFHSNAPKLELKTIHKVKIANSRYIHKIKIKTDEDITNRLIELLHTSYKLNQ